jgi:hypothetical protein
MDPAGRLGEGALTGSARRIGINAEDTYHRKVRRSDASGCKRTIRTRRARIRAMVRNPRTGEIAGAGMVVGLGIRAAGYPAPDADRVVRKSEIA